MGAWVTWPERPKGAKDKVKMPEGQKAGPKGRKLDQTRLLVSAYCRLADVLSGAEKGWRKFSQGNPNFVLGGVHLSGVRSFDRN